jgi:hypothetical protein
VVRFSDSVAQTPIHMDEAEAANLAHEAVANLRRQGRSARSFALPMKAHGGAIDFFWEIATLLFLRPRPDNSGYEIREESRPVPDQDVRWWARKPWTFSVVQADKTPGPA